MPTPITAKWPKPKSEDEFEDISVDFLRIRWQDPHTTRNGRRGQRQNGVDIFGRPPWLSGKIAAAQCKNTDTLDLSVVIAETEKSIAFSSELGEFLIITASDRDAALQAQVREYSRTSSFPFHIDVIFWQDITAELAVDEQIVAKYWKGFGIGSSMTVNIHAGGGPGGAGGVYGGGGGGGGGGFGGAGGEGGQATAPKEDK